MATTRRLTDVLNTLRKEEAALRGQLDKVRGAIAALGGGRQDSRQRKRKANRRSRTETKSVARDAQAHRSAAASETPPEDGFGGAG